MRSGRRRGIAVAVLVPAVLATATVAWAAPREHVDVPGPGASPRQVVETYLEAVAARDFATARTIDATGATYARFGRPLTARDVTFLDTDDPTHVVFTADFSGGDGTVSDGAWGYVLARGDDGRWQITGAGVV